MRGNLSWGDMTTNGPVFARIVGEYNEMPGLSLTAAQAGRLFGLASDQCLTVLQALVARGWLQCRAGGRYCAAGDRECVVGRSDGARGSRGPDRATARQRWHTGQ